MSSYTFKIKSYHAISTAEIGIDGITVLAGVNGSGKSTVSRWLYYIADGVCRFPSLVYEEMKERMMQELRNARMVYNDIYKSKYVSSHGSLDNGIKAFIASRYEEDHDGTQLLDLYFTCINIMGDIVEQYMQEPILFTQRNRVWKSLGGPFEGSDEKRLKAWLSMQKDRGEKLRQEYLCLIESKPIENLFSLIHSFYKETDDVPSFLSLKEDGVDILEKEKFNSLYGLTHAIYIDTPFAATEPSSDNFYWNALKEMMIYPSSDRFEFQGNKKKITSFISSLINGKVTEDNTIGNHELIYVSNDGTENVRLEKVATGFKSFAYILRLLDNGYLDDKTLLLIDEPEAHLHPQWIVDFAHVLVLLNKLLGVKIVIASHNPDMVEAVQAASEHENLRSQPHYYLSEKDKDGKYTFQDLGDNIAPIFESFNKALDKMEAMGEKSHE